MGASERIVERIRREGPIPYDRFVEIALYGDDGFFTRARGAGRAGRDFVTSPEVGPLFGVLVARALDGWWRELDAPDPFLVVEVGAGRGRLARDVLAAEPECERALRYVLVERSPALRAAQHELLRVEPFEDALGPVVRTDDDAPQPVTGMGPIVTALDELPAVALDGVVLANELLDNLPFRLAVFDGRWRDAFVADDGDRLGEVLAHPIDPLPAWLPPTAPHGARVPIQDEAAAWVRGALAMLDRGRVVAVDYAVARTAELALRPWREWLRTFAGHDRGGHYLADPGTQDVTTEVCVDQLPAPDVVRSQTQFLSLHGIDELVEDGRRAWAGASVAPSVRSLMMRSRIREGEALTDPAGLGGFSVLEWEVPSHR